jgi:hypothetical protein
MFEINKYNWKYMYWNGIFVHLMLLFCSAIDYYNERYHESHVEAGMAVLCGLVTLCYYFWCKRNLK